MSRRKPLFHFGRISVLLGLIIIVAACQGKASQPATPTPLPETPMSIPTPESIATFTSEATATPYPNARLLVDTAWLAEHLDDPNVRIIDMRAPEAYAEAHVPGAVNVPVDAVTSTINDVPFEFDREKVQAALNQTGLTPDTTAIIYDDLGMMNAARLFWTLEYVGHQDVRVLNGGWNAWVAEECAMTAEAPEIPPTEYPMQLDATKLASAEDVLDRLADPGVVLVDARSPQEYTGEVKLSARGGHIPGAVNLAWLDALTGGDAVYTINPDWQAQLQDEDVEVFRLTAEIQTLLDDLEITSDKEVITYCQTLWRGAHVYFLLRLMGSEDVRGYDGSWAEWGNRPDLPIVTGPEPGSLREATTGPQAGSDAASGDMMSGEMATTPWATPEPQAMPEGDDVALRSAGAQVMGVSSNYGGGDNDGIWGANNAIDGDPATEWSSDGDGDDAWIEIELAQEYDITAIGLWTRTMGASAQIESFRVHTDGGEVLGPFELKDASGIYFFPVRTRARRLRFEVLSSSGGNTGAVEIAVYTPVKESSSNALDPLSIESLRQHRDDPPPTIEIVAPLMETEYFIRHQVVYTSDGLRITGVVNVPKRDTPTQGFPVILLNHGYYSPSGYTPGTGTQREADYLAEHGYVTIASDYRGYASSEGDFGGHFDPGWTYDILDLLDALPSLNVVDPERVGMWGHSTGGEIALRVIVARDTVDATVLFGSMGADAADNFRLVQGWGGGHAVVQRYGAPEEAPEVWAKLSPMTYLADASGPISIHHGELDGEVPPELSARLREAMQAVGVPGEYYTYPDQHHIFWGEAWALAMERTLAFFDRYVKNQ